MPGPLSKFICTDRKPLREVENLPSTSKGPLSLQDSQKPLKENEAPAPATVEPDTVVENLEIQEYKLEDKYGPNTAKKVVTHKKMTKNERSLYQKLVNIRIKLSKCRNRAQKQSLQLKAAKNFMKNSNFIATINNMPSAAKLLTMLQFRESKKKEKGRRFSTEEKILALAMLKQSPKGYRFLRRMLVLPSQQILNTFLNQANIKPGINMAHEHLNRLASSNVDFVMVRISLVSTSSELTNFEHNSLFSFASV
ncbi:uncharacterized protein LOC123700756 [Colias croceus]|uniref:uncharacterized protein LOC123700756 n=1 Tax=Colias crocea TaxID=72248 RepID=UPI001E27CFF7|nr:uncharacterized protein LOC123700756 [Colias croceus]